MSVYPISISALLSGESVESVRREFKKTWTAPIRDAVIRTICAFANDLKGLNGGYIVLGIEERDGKPIMPPIGLGDETNLEIVQKEIRGSCKAITPEYQPVVDALDHQGKNIIVIWAPPGDVRPYQAPKTRKGEKKYWVRLGAETIEAKGEILNELMRLTARVSFDNRIRRDVPLSSVSSELLREYLSDIKSAHADFAPDSFKDTLRDLRLTARSNGDEFPRNIALLFFSQHPDKHLPGAWIELAHFRDDAGGDLIERKEFRGPVHRVVRNVLEHLNGLFGEVLRKIPSQMEVERFVAYPYEALEEALVNAVYHRGYDSPTEATRIGLYPDRLEITSFPGPVPGIEPKHLQPDGRPPQLPARNPHVGELLKSLRLAETWHTGIPKIHRRMSENGSPPPLFDFDEQRTYFRVTLPAHPGYIVLHALREAAGLWHVGDRERALAHLHAARQRVPHAGSLAAQLIEYATALEDLAVAKKTLMELEQTEGAVDRHLAYIALARAYLDRGRNEDARVLLQNAPFTKDPRDTVELAILHKRSNQFQEAHRLFQQVEEAIQGNPKALHEYAQVKMKLSAPRDAEKLIRQKLHREAEEILRRVINLSADQHTRAAWAYFDLARVMQWSGQLSSEIRRACEKAAELEPGEKRFHEFLARLDESQKI